MTEALVVGHICLDVIPALKEGMSFEPGKLVEAGPATLSPGGAVSNTGICLSRLGVATKLIAKVGDDLFGAAVQEILSKESASPRVRVSQVAGTSYTVVVSMTNRDRMFLHYPGANQDFGPQDVTDEELGETKLFHLGYPPLLAQMYENDGASLELLFRRAKDAGATTSLDLSLPDADAPSGKANWALILERVLPYVDFFLPSVEEILYMLEPKMFENLKGVVYGRLPQKQIEKLVARSIELGAKNVGVKVGSRGFYLRLGDQSYFGRAKPAWSKWAGFEFWHPCFKVEVQGTTGAGDATIAGFLRSMLRGTTPFEACRSAVAVGAACCEKTDSISGVGSWENIDERVKAGWERLPLEMDSSWKPFETGLMR